MDAPTTTWLGNSSDYTPGFDFNLGEPGNALNGDILHSQYSLDNGGSWTDYVSHTLTVSELVDLAITETDTPLAGGVYLFRARLERGTDVSSWSSSETVTLIIVQTAIQNSGGAGAPRRRRAQYENYDSIVRREKIQEIEALKAAVLARGEVAPRLAEKAQEFVPYRDTMSITTLVAELARVQRELEDEEDMLVIALLH